MLEPNDAEFAADNADEACKSDYFSDEGDAKNDTAKLENPLSSKRKPDDADIFDSKKIKVSEQTQEELSSKSCSASQSDTSEFVRAGSVTSDNSDEFVDASDDLIEPPPLPDKTQNKFIDNVDSHSIKEPVTSDPKSNTLEPEVPRLKSNKFIERLPTFADDPLERFNSSAMRRGLTKDIEPIKPIDFNFDFTDRDKTEPKNENKMVKKVKLNRSKFFSPDKPKFSDESSSDSNSKFNVGNTTTSPVKLDAPPPPENKERNFKNVDKTFEDIPIKPPAIEKKPTPVEPPPVANKNETSQIEIKPALNSSSESETSSSSAKDDSQSSSVDLVEEKVTKNLKDLQPQLADIEVRETSNEETTAKDEIIADASDQPLQKIEEALLQTEDTPEPVKSNDEIGQIANEEIFENPDQDLVLTTEPSILEINEKTLPEIDESEKFEEIAPKNVENKISRNSDDNSPSNVDHEIQDKTDDEPTTRLANQDIEPASETVPEFSEIEEIHQIPNTEARISDTKASPPQPETSTVEELVELPEVVPQNAPEPEKTIEIPNTEEVEPIPVIDAEPEPHKVETVDSASDTEDQFDDKSEPDLSNEETEDEGEEEEDEDEEEEIIHEEEVYLEDRMPIYSSRPEPQSPPPKQQSPQPTISPPRQDDSDDVMEVDAEETRPSSIRESPTPVESSLQERRRTSSFENIQNIEDIPMEVDDDHKIPSSSSDAPSTDDLTKPKELSKLEQALIGKPSKKLEIQLPEPSMEMVQSVVNDYPGERPETEETKEKIKLHLSLQGDKVSIKKGPLDTPPSVVRVKRQYRKRRLEDLKTTDKTYKLRNRTTKKAEEGTEPCQPNGTVETSNANEKPVDVAVANERKQPPVPRAAEPLTIDLDDSDSCSETPKHKIQPIKLKIGKNANVTIESAPLRADNPPTEEIRKKDNNIPNYMEQAATAWSGPDLQRVERLLKESNITITPVVPKDTAPQTPTPCVIKPIPKEKPTFIAPQFSTPSSALTTSSSLQTNTACVTPIVKDKTEDREPTKTPNGDVSPDAEDPLLKFKITRTEGIDVTPISSGRPIDVKSEIRKKLALGERKKLDSGRDSNDSESESSDSKSKSKSTETIPTNLPTPEMLPNLGASGANTTPEPESSDGKGKPDIDPAFLPLLQTLPRKRGRPTKAMVAAREALKQSQEVALENLRQLASQKNGEAEDIMAHFPIPLFDITDPENPFKPKRGRKPKSEKFDKSDGDQSAMEDPILDPIREQEEIKRLEEERIKKEEEKERRNEIRRLKAKERNDLVKAKRLRQKMKAEERQKRMQEKRRQLQEEKKKLEEEIKNLPQSLPGFDDETRMSAENSQLQTTSYSLGIGDEDSSNATTEFSQRVKKSRMEVTDADSKDLTVDQIAEYQWPIQGGDLYMIQEQVSNYLGVKSFKRKYPDIKRRPVDSEERAYLVDSGLVSETLCDLGLTAVSSAELLDIMCADFPDKYEELRKYMREKQMKELSFKQKAWANGLGYKLLMADGTKQDLKKRAMDSASNWNSALNKSRSEDRRCAMDLQTFIVHYPKCRTQNMSISTPKIGSYPVSILPGQFCDFYKNYTSTELRYMPINTVLYGPLKPHDVNIAGDGSQTDSDDSSSSDESSTTSEGTQATEDTIEDTDNNMSVDESSQLDKTHDINMLKESMTMELSENTRELIMDEAAKILCKVCLGNMARNKENVPEVLICCSQCSSTSHPTCLDLSLDMVPHIKKYPWQCSECKTCGRCKENADEDKMLFCDTCDRGYHIYCIGLKKVPSGNWQCQECVNICINSPAVREVFKEPSLIEIQDG